VNLHQDLIIILLAASIAINWMEFGRGDRVV